jgi:hypothetical protein
MKEITWTEKVFIYFALNRYACELCPTNMTKNKIILLLLIFFTKFGQANIREGL